MIKCTVVFKHIVTDSHIVKKKYSVHHGKPPACQCRVCVRFWFIVLNSILYHQHLLECFIPTVKFQHIHTVVAAKQVTETPSRLNSNNLSPLKQITSCSQLNIYCDCLLGGCRRKHTLCILLFSHVTFLCALTNRTDYEILIFPSPPLFPGSVGTHNHTVRLDCLSCHCNHQ